MKLGCDIRERKWGGWRQVRTASRLSVREDGRDSNIFTGSWEGPLGKE